MAIELKFPRNGQYPEQMFSFVKDLVFLEQLKAAGFGQAALVIFADDPLFYEGPTSGIYDYFRARKGTLVAEQKLCGQITKPTGSRDEELLLHGEYLVTWKPVRDKLRYAVIEVS